MGGKKVIEAYERSFRLAIARNALAQQEAEMGDILDDPFLPSVIDDRPGCAC